MSASLIAAILPVLALLIDLALGDPPTAIHPVGWMGWWIYRFRRGFSGKGPRKAPFLQGILFVIFSVTAVGGIAGLIQLVGFRLAAGHHIYGYILGVTGMALFLKGSLAFRSLIGAGRLVQAALKKGDLPVARYHLSRNLVSRPVSGLPEEGIVSAAIESLSENYVDSVVAPLFWFAIAGLPGAWIYRFADTADSILGYRDEEREWLGKASARLDDILCWIPARLGAWLLILSAALSGLDTRGAATVMLRDASQCRSPNSGWPMAAAAGALGIRLEKRDTYVLNDLGHSPSVDHLNQVVCMLNWALVLSTFLFAGIAGLLYLLLR